MAVKLNFSNVNYCCRTCMTGNSLLNIFEDSLNCVSIAEILTSCTSININKNDELPKRICQICYEKLHSFHRFKISIEDVDAKFRKLLEDETHFICDKKDIKVDNDFLLDERKIVNVKEENQVDINSISETHNVFVFEGNICNDIETHNTNNAHKLEPNQKAEYNNKKYICEICKKIFKNHHNYLKHCKKHTYNNNEMLNKMIHDKVYKNRTIKCDVCASVFKTLETLSAHMKVHGNDKDLTCVINLDNQKNDNILSTVSENVGEFRCKVCKDPFRSKNSLSAHMRKHVQKGRVLACSVCGKIFSKISHLKRHEYSHEDKHRFKCTICKKLYPTKENLQEHSKQHKDAKPLVCPVCQKAFFHMASLNTHIKVHTRDKLYLCPFCGKRFDSSTNLNQHIRRHIGIKAFSCALCPRKFVSKGELKSHSITHTGERTYKCERCNASFTKHSSLTQHNLRHLGVKPHQCDTCRMKFVSKSQLTRHYRIHTGEKPYRCDMCERAYTQSNDLAKHRRGHLGDKIYKCNECSEGFRLKAELQQHISQHYVSQIGEQKNDLTTKDKILGLSSS